MDSGKTESIKTEYPSSDPCPCGNQSLVYHAHPKGGGAFPVIYDFATGKEKYFDCKGCGHLTANPAGDKIIGGEPGNTNLLVSNYDTKTKNWSDFKLFIGDVRKEIAEVDTDYLNSQQIALSYPAWPLENVLIVTAQSLKQNPNPKQKGHRFLTTFAKIFLIDISGNKPRFIPVKFVDYPNVSFSIYTMSCDAIAGKNMEGIAGSSYKITLKEKKDIIRTKSQGASHGLDTPIAGVSEYCERIIPAPMSHRDGGNNRCNAMSGQPLVYVAIWLHNHDPFQQYEQVINDKNIYSQRRNTMLKLIRYMKENNMPWSWQIDWNYLEAIIKYEVEAKDEELLKQTEGLNILQYAQKNGVEIDPHCHENSGYNYADVAYLIQKAGVTPSCVVGGHLWDPNGEKFQNWSRFTNGIYGEKYGNSAFWKPTVLMGAASYKHSNDPSASGVWKPKSKDEFFTHDPNSNLVSIGGWSRDGNSLTELISKIQNGEIQKDKMYTYCMGMSDDKLNNKDSFDFLSNRRFSLVKDLEKDGLIKIVYLQDMPKIWQEKFNEEGFVYGPFYFKEEGKGKGPKREGAVPGPGKGKRRPMFDRRMPEASNE
jgi:hypothetical protein